MRQALIGCAAALLVALPGAALAWRAANGHHVHDLGGGVFEVVGRVGSGAQEYWCGAGDYAIAVLGAAAAQRVYIWRPLGASATERGAQGGAVRAVAAARHRYLHRLFADRAAGGRQSERGDGATVLLWRPVRRFPDASPAVSLP